MLPTKGVECQMKNLPSCETFGRSKVDDLSFVIAIRSISPSQIGEAKMSICCVFVCSHVCEDQVEV